MVENRSSQKIFSTNLHTRILTNLSHKLVADANPQKDVQKGTHDANIRRSYLLLRTEREMTHIFHFLYCVAGLTEKTFMYVMKFTSYYYQFFSTGSGVHPTPYAMGTRGSFSKSKAAGA
jgi:hypothetical protein